MTTLLAIETSTEMASIALLSKSGLICRELTGVQTHSQGVLPAIQDILKEAGVTLKQCAAIAYGCGPGAFTGVRTACGIVQGLAFGADLPILPIVSLLAMAQAAYESQLADDVVCVLDARMGEVYWAHYHYQDNVWTQVSEPALSTGEQVFAYANLNKLTLVLGNGIALKDGATEKIINQMPHAEQIARLALIDFSMEKQLAAADAQPLYLRNKIALTTAERALVKSN
ncbi:MAG: tRNA (adenosine(37)-N6)-threonylcarbamoyltransferase complex dimerization subunit type 1 TsaB [Undibacterium sp.]|nr:tRNA (adenosine(37)-N6)-threonylcarbamoyltransferase complex dimerization subunit type 1 TsaB [Undibacterium sp.]